MSNYSAQYKPSIAAKPSVKAQTPQDPTKFPTDLESTIFSPSQVPDEVKAAVSIWHSLIEQKLNLGDISKGIINHIRTSYENNYELDAETLQGSINDSSFLSLQKSLKLSDLDSNFGVVYTSLYRLLRVIVRNKISLSKARSGLLSFHVPVEVVDAIVLSVGDIRSQPIKVTKFNTPYLTKFTTLSKLRWRVDVVISSGSLSRVMRPTILMQVSSLFVLTSI